MAIPTYDQFIEPLLRFLARHPEGARTAVIYEPLADEMKLSESEREELLPCGAQAVYKNRIGWAQDRLKRAE
jgi:restriction system protein